MSEHVSDDLITADENEESNKDNMSSNLIGSNGSVSR